MTTQAVKSEAEPIGPQSHQSTKGEPGVIQRLFGKLGPGLVTGASDDDPSGIATYSQVGAHFGYGLLWTIVLSYP